MKREERSRLSPEAFQHLGVRQRGIDGKVDRKKENPENLGEKLRNECFIDVEGRKCVKVKEV